MNKVKVRDKVLEIINNNFERGKIKSNQYDEDLNILGIESIKLIQIMVELEETFQIEIPDEYLLVSEMGTVNKILDVILSIVKISEEYD